MGTFPNHGSTIFEMEQHAHATFITLLKVWVLQMINQGSLMVDTWISH
jgi:hypothetical protein